MGTLYVVFYHILLGVLTTEQWPLDALFIIRAGEAFANCEPGGYPNVRFYLVSVRQEIVESLKRIVQVVDLLRMPTALARRA